MLETVFAKEEPTRRAPLARALRSALQRPPKRYPGIAAPPSAPRPVAVAGPRYDLPLGGSSQVPRPSAGAGQAVDDDPPARHRRGPGQLGRADRHDDPRRDPARDRPGGRLRDPAQPGRGAARRRAPRKAEALRAAAERALRLCRERCPVSSRAAAIPGATALKQAVSSLLGVRVDYYALVNLRGFADLVDGLGGVRILVKERLVDEVTRPAWGEPKPRIDVQPGRRYHFYGREALAYVRSRKDSNDYTRMARQRCFLSAMADQLDPVRVLRNFPGLARTVERNVATDVPLRRLPALVRLVGGNRPEGDADGDVRRRVHREPAQGRQLPAPEAAADADGGARGDPLPGAREAPLARVGRQELLSPGSRQAHRWRGELLIRLRIETSLQAGTNSQSTRPRAAPRGIA